jgi:3-hydroxyisobutyrate dehydrogenase
LCSSASPLLLGSTIVAHIEPAAAGAAMTFAGSLPLAVYWTALGEALSIALASGIDARFACDLLGDSPGVAKVRIPSAIADGRAGHAATEEAA